MLLRSDVLSALTVTLAIGLAVQSDLARSLLGATNAPQGHQAVSFAEDIVPILEEHCTECHSEENAELGLKVDTYEGLMAGSDYGTVVEAGDADGSLFIDMIVSGDMPEDGDPMPADELEMLKTWIDEGAENN